MFNTLNVKKIHFKKFAAGGLASRQWSLKKIQRLGLSG